MLDGAKKAPAGQPAGAPEVRNRTLLLLACLGFGHAVLVFLAALLQVGTCRILSGSHRRSAHRTTERTSDHASDQNGSGGLHRSEEHTAELQALIRLSYDIFR